VVKAQRRDIVQATIDWLRTTEFLLPSDESNTKDKMQYRYVLATKAFAALRHELPDIMMEKDEKGKPKSLGEKGPGVWEGYGEEHGGGGR